MPLQHKDERGRIDRLAIDIKEDWQRHFWSTRFGVSQEELLAAVQAVGARADDVSKYLGNKPIHRRRPPAIPK
ncbi:MAG: DUF3606 domain-containing protein [Betaproteobacteria bacterium]